MEAQQQMICDFAQRERLTIVNRFTEVETGKGSDALLRRPQLLAALCEARKDHAPVIVAKLDRLSRDVHFISGLMAERVEFIVADLGRQADPFILHVYAALAEKERKLISERVCAALQAAKRRGVKLGISAMPAEKVRAMRQAAGKTIHDRAEAWAKANAWAIEAALKETSSYRAAAELLNGRGMRSRTGGLWHASTVRCSGRMLGLSGPKSRRPKRALSKLAKATRQEIIRDKADSWANATRWVIQAAMNESSTYSAAAEVLNGRGMRSPKGGVWNTSSVWRSARRLGLTPKAKCQAQVRATQRAALQSARRAKRDRAEAWLEANRCAIEGALKAGPRTEPPLSS